MKQEKLPQVQTCTTAFDVSFRCKELSMRSFGLFDIVQKPWQQPLEKPTVYYIPMSQSHSDKDLW